MRKLLLFCLLLTNFGSNAQTTVQHPFPTDSAAWYETRNTSDYWSYEYGCNMKYFYNGFDTVGNVIYHKVFFVSRCYCYVIDAHLSCGTPNPSYNDTTYSGILLRTDSNKVFIKEGTDAEFKLYDYNKNVGDTMIYIKPWFGDTVILECVLIDSALTNIGYLKQWNFTMSQNGFSWGCPFDTLKWIEGTSSNHGVFYHWALQICNTVDQGDDSNTLCFMERDTFVLGGGLQTCEFPIIIGINENSVSPQTAIYPNPATNEFTVLLNNPAQKLGVTLYSITGQQVAIYSAAGKQIVIPRTNLPAGMYLVQVNADNKQSYQRIVLE